MIGDLVAVDMYLQGTEHKKQQKLHEERKHTGHLCLDNEDLLTISSAV